MLNKKTARAQAVEMVDKLESTQDSIVKASEFFQMCSTRGVPEIMVEVWRDKMKNSTASTRISLIFLVNHIIQEVKDQGKLKDLFKEILEEYISLAYRNTADRKIRDEIINVLEIWKERKVYEEDLIDGIIKKVRSHGSTPKRKHKRPNLKDASFHVPVFLEEYSEGLQLAEECRIKFSSLKEDMEALLKPRTIFPQVETECKVAEYQKVRQLYLKQVCQLSNQSSQIISSQDNIHLQETLLLKKILNLKSEVKNFKEKIQQKKKEQVSEANYEVMQDDLQEENNEQKIERKKEVSQDDKAQDKPEDKLDAIEDKYEVHHNEEDVIEMKDTNQNEIDSNNVLKNEKENE